MKICASLEFAQKFAGIFAKKRNNICGRISVGVKYIYVGRMRFCWGPEAHMAWMIQAYVSENCNRPTIGLHRCIQSWMKSATQTSLEFMQTFFLLFLNRFINSNNFIDQNACEKIELKPSVHPAWVYVAYRIQEILFEYSKHMHDIVMCLKSWTKYIGHTLRSKSSLAQIVGWL